MSRFTPSLLGRSLRRASAVASSSASTFVRPMVSARPSRAFFASTPSRLAEETRSPHQGDGAFSAGPSPKEHDELVHAGTTAVELGDMAEASRCYAAALEISRSAGVLFNLGVVQYCLSESRVGGVPGSSGTRCRGIARMRLEGFQLLPLRPCVSLSALLGAYPDWENGELCRCSLNVLGSRIWGYVVRSWLLT